MAQLKDLLVTGPVRIIGDVNFNKLPKYNNINLATANDISNVATAAATAQGRADEAYTLASGKTTMEDVEDKGYATIQQAQGYANAVLGTTLDSSGAATVYGANKAASAAAAGAADAYARADSVLAESKDYTDDTTAALKNDLLNGAGAAYDTLKELGELIDTNTDAIDALETIAALKADTQKGNTFDGEQKMLNSIHCGTIYDIASGIGCSLKNARALSDQAIIGELLLPVTAKNTKEDPDWDGVTVDHNVCQVRANEMGVYIIKNWGKLSSDTNHGKITSKTLIGKFTANGWEGNVTGALSGNASSATKWATARTLTIGATGKSIDGTADVAWTPYEMRVTRAQYGVDKNMNQIADHGCELGMANLEGTDTTINPNGGINWHHYINMTWSDTKDNNNKTDNEWCTQIANKVGTTDLWVRSRNGGSIADGTAWAAPWTRILTGSNWTSVVDGRYLKLDGGGTMTGSPVIKFPASAGEIANSDPMVITYGRISAYGTLHINADSDGSKSEYLILTAGRGFNESTTASGLAIGYSTLTWKDNAIMNTSNGGTNGYIPKFTAANTIENSAITDNGTSIALGRSASVSGLLTVTNQNNTVTIGSQNQNQMHIYNSANIPFIFNKAVASTDGDLGTDGYPWKNIKLNGELQFFSGTTQKVYFKYHTSDNCIDVIFK